MAISGPAAAQGSGRDSGGDSADLTVGSRQATILQPLAPALFHEALVMRQRAMFVAGVRPVWRSPVHRRGAVAVAIRIARDPKQPIDEEYTNEDQGVHDRAVLQLAAGRLPAGVEDGADAEDGARRHRRRAGSCPTRKTSTAYMRMLEKASPRVKVVLDRQDRRRPRDDRRGGRVGSDHGEARREPRAPRQARRPAHDQHGRRARPTSWSPRRRRSTTSPARSTRRRPARRPR